MLHGKTARKVAWVSPDGKSCRPLLDSLNRYCEDIGCSLDVCETETFRPEQYSDRDRIVLVAPSRAAYPQDEVAWLTTSTNVVPWGVVTESYYMGSRRSGQGPVTHWQQPWFRWWDSWAGWFFPEFVRPGSLMANAFSPVVTPLDYATPTITPQLSSGGQRLAIVCSCRQTASMLQQQAAQAGWSALIHRSIADFLAAGPKAIEDIVWDDSVLPSLPGVELNESVDELMNRLTKAAPATRLIASIGLENLYLWPTLQKWSGCEVLVKPSHALALSNYLVAREYIA